MQEYISMALQKMEVLELSTGTLKNKVFWFGVVGGL